MIDKKSSILNWVEVIGVILISLVLSALLFIYNKPLGAIAFATCGYTAVHFKNLISAKRKAHIDELENIESNFSDATRCALFGMPFPMCILSWDGEITWYNTRFKTLVDSEDLLNKKIEKMIPAVDAKRILNRRSPQSIETTIKGRTYQFYYNVVETYKQDEGNIILLYAVDNTEDYRIATKYLDEATTIMVIQIDNFDELSQSVDDSNRPLVLAEIDKLIATFATEYHGFARKYEPDKYLCVFQQQDLFNMIREKFPIVERVREMNLGNKIPPTLSIGIGAGTDNPLEIYKVARLAVDVALGRGGDQIVVNDGENLTYYGGKKKAIEKHNKVKSRVISHALAQLVDQSDCVYVMGHKNPDMDSFGSCLGIYSFVKSRDKNCRIVLEDITAPIESVYKLVMRELPSIGTDILKPDRALEEIGTGSLVVVLDNHRRGSTEAPKLLDATDQVVLIDHHRRGADYIEDPTLTYLEPYSSSASELVTELIQYNESDIEIPKVIADALLAGITVDTKSFTIQTGVRTFEAASVLKRYGADSINVKKLFREPENTVRYRSAVVADASLYRDVIAISRFEEELENSVLIAAQAADRMLDIRGVEASFVSTFYKDKIHISGRSVGDISVQIILEKIGGGGHQTSAGVQLGGVDMDMADKVLKNAIDEYLNEEEKIESNSEE